MAVVGIGLIAASGLAATESHTVRPGDTLSGIAQRYGTTVNALAAANGITNPHLIVIGKRISVPAAGASGGGGGGGAAATTRYTVRAGDNLSSIASRHGTTVAAIASANGISNPNLVVIGRTLTIPGGSGSAATSGGGGSAPTGPVNPSAGTVGVQSGDSLSSVAARAGVSTSTLIAANRIPAPYTVYAGGRLFTAVRNGNRVPDLQACPVPGANFMNDWGFGRAGSSVHEGTDMMAPRGTAVRAPVAGTATQVVGSVGGNQIRLTGNDGSVYWLTHLNGFAKTGSVSAGTTVGYVGNSGNAAGGPTHLHFQIHPAGGKAVNPYISLRAVC